VRLRPASYDSFRGMGRTPKLDLEYIAKLARLKLSPQEKKKFSQELADVLAYIEKLNELKLDDTPPTFQTTGSADVTREDRLEPVRILKQEEALSNTRAKERGFFRVPKVLG